MEYVTSQREEILNPKYSESGDQAIRTCLWQGISESRASGRALRKISLMP